MLPHKVNISFSKSRKHVQIMVGNSLKQRIVCCLSNMDGKDCEFCPELRKKKPVMLETLVSGQISKWENYNFNLSSPLLK